ncbi:MAG: hypothetical protein BEN18_11410 [Epulopiscium sp. Nuni2H_MBin001]|nr:MAG: hypothetical protein BEN18_11410 [Epulopiscium sp. Nuni2H_MBin001]
MNDYKIEYIEIESIVSNPYQARKKFSLAQLQELSDSIVSNGVINPIKVRKFENAYEIVTGERRLRAAKMAKLKYIPAIITKINTKQSAILSIIENINQEKLHFIEEIEAYQVVIDYFGYTKEELAKTFGQSSSVISAKLRLLNLEEQVKKKILDYNLTLEQATLIQKLPDELLRIRAVNKLGKHKTELPIEIPKKKINKTYIKDLRLFTNTIDQAVELIKNSGIKTEYNIEENDTEYKVTINILK